VTVIHSIVSAQSRVTTLHLIIHELLVFLVVPVVIEVTASMRRRRRSDAEPWLALMSDNAACYLCLACQGCTLESQVQAHETHAREIHAREIHAYETSAHQMHARGMHAREVQINHKRSHAICRDLSLQKLVFHNSDLDKRSTQLP
jgi:hypothetical protein